MHIKSAASMDESTTRREPFNSNEYLTTRSLSGPPLALAEQFAVCSRGTATEANNSAKDMHLTLVCIGNISLVATLALSLATSYMAEYKRNECLSHAQALMSGSRRGDMFTGRIVSALLRGLQ
jgi:hypothetical protein